ncbi:hypothetical protein VTL71DRAFT_1860 [Oculimacula yallundae]|uniref:DNA polymerase lambda n=1 Tax=Oculimacula yallundae TaxID=86028 RepID=A0ABR4CCF5_9HELO
MQDKEEYFKQLYSLNESSDDEEVDTNDAREILRQSKPAVSSSASSSFPAARASQRRSQASGVGEGAFAVKKAPGIHRTTSAPVASTSRGMNAHAGVDETQTQARAPLPQLSRKPSLLRRDISVSTSNLGDIKTPQLQPKSADTITTTPTSTPTPTPTSVTDLSITSGKPVPERSASTPNIGSVVMNNSKGIAAMLGKRTAGEGLAKGATKKSAKAAKKPVPKKKKDEIKLVPENERILSGKTLFWIPPDDVVLMRKRRIDRAREFGAVWTKEWTADVTHVVVDNNLTYRDVMNFLSPTIKSNELPRHVILVNETYMIDCGRFKNLLDHDQARYIVDGYGEATGSQGKSPPGSQQSEQSLQLKAAKPRKDDPVPEVTPSQSQRSTQPEAYDGPVDTSSIVSLIPAYLQEFELPTNFIMSTTSDSNKGKRGDALDEFIELAHRVQHLPLDDEYAEDEETPAFHDDPYDSGGSEEEKAFRKKPKRKYKKYPGDKLASFKCMHGGTGKTHEDNPNRHTIDILEQMAAYYGRIKDHWRQRAYQQAVGTLKELTVKLESSEDAIRLPFIGESIAAKIEEICVTGHLRRLDNALDDPDDKVLQLFLKIYGVGLSTANAWIRAGHKTLEDLSAIKLHRNQRIGIEHYYDFDQRIPRDEVTALGDIVIKAAAEIDPVVELVIGGSYRRGATDSGDIDFIITKRGTTSSLDLLPFLNRLTKQLEQANFLTFALATPRETGSKWHGACVLPGNPVWRRIDLLVVPETEFGAALIYFTGDDIFNRSMRLLASKFNMRLNQRGLYKDVLRVNGPEKVNDGTLVEGADERKIFDALGVPWRPPFERICR